MPVEGPKIRGGGRGAQQILDLEELSGGSRYLRSRDILAKITAIDCQDSVQVQDSGA